TIPDSPERDARELRLSSSFAQTLAVTKGIAAPEVLDMNSRARNLAEKIGDLPGLVHQLWAGAQYAAATGDYFSGAAMAAQALEAAEREGSPIGLAFAHQTSLTVRFWLGDFAAVEDHFARGRVFVKHLASLPRLWRWRTGCWQPLTWRVGMHGLLDTLIPPASVVSACAGFWRELSGIHWSLRSPKSGPPICTPSC